MLPRPPRVLIALLLTGLALAPCLLVAATAHVFWASDPVRPDETVLVQGSDLEGVSVELARLPSGHTAAPESPAKWTSVPVIQGGAQSLKFTIPADWELGVYACRIMNGETPVTIFLNAPDPWWMQGDEGDAGTPGGWLQVMGKSLANPAWISPDPSNRTESEGSLARLEADDGKVREITASGTASENLSLYLALPEDLAPGNYQVRVHNGSGGESAWRPAGTFNIVPPVVTPEEVFSVLDFYGPNAVAEMRKSLVKYSQPPDRTEGILAALKKAKDNGGGVVFFPAGRYKISGGLTIPEHTILRGEGMGVVTLWWGEGHFNLDGGGPQGRARIEEPKPPHVLIGGPDFAIEEMSLFLPLDYEQGLVAERRFRMDKVRVRIDHYWLVQGRGNGTVARLGRNFAVTNCDILAKGDALVPGQFGIIGFNRISANKSNTPLGNSSEVIVENNLFVSMDPTTYQNIAGVGRNLFYAFNQHESLYAQQADYSFTFDAGSGAYLGALAEVNGTALTLAEDPVYPQWAPEKHRVWKRAAVFILSGRGAGQWRDVTKNEGRAWEIDRPFEVAPDATSLASIVTFNGRTIIANNTFKDANWVNTGYGTSIDVICSGNDLYRCADLMNYGLRGEHGFQPSWHVQYFENTVSEGQTNVGSSSGSRDAERYAGPITSSVIHRRQVIAPDNSGGISIGGNVRDAIVEGCQLEYPTSAIKVDAAAEGIFLRNNHFAGEAHYEGGGIKNAIVLPAAR